MKRFLTILAVAMLAIGSVSAQKKAVEALTTDVEALKQQNAALLQQVEALKQNEAKVQQQLSDVKAREESVHQRLNTLSNDNAALKAEQEAANAKMVVVIDKVNELIGQVNALSLQVNELTNQVNTLNTQVEVLNDSIAKLAARPVVAAEAAKPKYEVVGEMCCGMVLVKEGLLYGYVNSNSEYIIAAQYEEAESFVNGYARVKKNDKWGVVNAAGEETIACSYGEVSHYSGTLWKVKQGELYGLLSAVNGAAVQPIKYTSIGSLWFQRAEVAINGKYGFFDETGKLVIAAQYDSSSGFDETGLCCVSKNENTFYIDKNGNFVRR